MQIKIILFDISDVELDLFREEPHNRLPIPSGDGHPAAWIGEGRKEIALKLKTHGGEKLKELKTHGGEKPNKCNQCDLTTHEIQPGVWLREGQRRSP